ncbi:MAG: LON peptidase substrate-binding domain-containing protein, partial [Bacteroidales bacterium]
MSENTKLKIGLNNFLMNDDMSDGGEFIPLISEEEDLEFSDEVPEELPILPLRNTVLFPGVILPITVGREKSLRLLEEANKGNKVIGTITQTDANIEEPLPEDIFSLGTVAKILRILEMPDGSTSVIIQGKQRFRIEEYLQEEPFLKARITLLKDATVLTNQPDFEAVVGSLKDMALRIIKLSTNIPQEASFAVKNIEHSKYLVNFICSNTDIELVGKQLLLEMDDLYERSIKLMEFLAKEIQMLELKNDIQSKVKVDMDKQQREYFLHQQMK